MVELTRTEFWEVMIVNNSKQDASKANMNVDYDEYQILVFMYVFFRRLDIYDVP